MVSTEGVGAGAGAEVVVAGVGDGDGAEEGGNWSWPSEIWETGEEAVEVLPVGASTWPSVFSETEATVVLEVAAAWICPSEI